MSMNAKPKDAIERMKAWHAGKDWWACFTGDAIAILAYLDSIPDGAVPVVWPAELTRERLEELVCTVPNQGHREALRALAAIAPQKKKRVVNLWESKHTKPIAFPVGEAPEVGTWRCVARNVELED